MEEIQVLLDRTCALQAQVTAMQQTLQKLQDELEEQATILCEKVGDAPSKRKPSIQKAKVAASASRLPNGRAMFGSPAPGERRISPRRRGNPVAILISEPGSEAPMHAWAVDRSPDGLCLVTERAIPVGTLLKVCPTDSAAGWTWFEVEVKNCHAERKAWILGCQFLAKLSWKDLRLFS